MHFTPMQIGASLYLYWKIHKNHSKDFDLYAETRRFLVQSIDMCHMGRTYYEVIDKMYYLYDDFNDNQVHRNHALQMAGSELTKKCLTELTERHLRRE